MARNEIERRIVPGLLEVRADEEGTPDRIVGHASVFNEWTTLYESADYLWREVVRPGAYARALVEGHDVRALWNHDANFVLGRTLSGTLRLAEDERGLLSDITPPDSQLVRDLVLAPIRRGDVSQMSFAFLPNRVRNVREELEDGTILVDRGGERITIRREGNRVIEDRELLDVDLFDVSPVTYPAYPGTDVGVRSQADARLSEWVNLRPSPRGNGESLRLAGLRLRRLASRLNRKGSA